MSWWMRALVFVPAVFLIMVVYTAPHATDAAGVARRALQKTGKVCAWTIVLIVFMEALQWAFFP